jgi:hypothetical protein
VVAVASLLSPALSQHSGTMGALEAAYEYHMMLSVIAVSQRPQRM